MLKEKSFWEQTKNLPILLEARLSQLLELLSANDTIIDNGLQDLKTETQAIGTPAVGCRSVETPNGMITEFSFVDRASASISSFIPNTEAVFIIPNGSAVGGMKLQGTHYVANPATGKITFLPPNIPVPGDILMLNCQKPITLLIDDLSFIDINKWLDPNYSEEEV